MLLCVCCISQLLYLSITLIAMFRFSHQDLAIHLRFYRKFPQMEVGKYKITSPQDGEYNCVAWALDRDDVKVRPDGIGGSFWPEEVPGGETLDTFMSLFAFYGFQECPDAQLELGFEKIALYAEEQEGQQLFRHVARQLEAGGWSSKLGDYEDISHDEVAALESVSLGQVVIYMKRPSISGDFSKN